MSRAQAWCRAATVAGGVLLADQATKAFVRETVQRGSSDPVFPGVELVNTRNSGVAFGLFSDGGMILSLVTVGALLALLAYFATHATRALLWVPTGLLFGGAAGNLIDRVREGSVTDFIDLPLWPAFNLADVAITSGVFALLLVLEAGAGSRTHTPAASPHGAD